MSEMFVVRGGVPLHGTAEVCAAKNAVLPAIAAGLLTEGMVRLRGAPHLLDVEAMGALAEKLGGKVAREGEELTVSGAKAAPARLGYELCARTRASVLLLSVCLARFGKADIAMPGGCAIGSRPVDLHLKGLARMGAQIRTEHGCLCAEAPQGLRPASLYLDVPSVGATENLMMAATAAPGTTVIANAATEPEVEDLARLLVGMGADIENAGTDRLVIHGGRPLHGTTHAPIPDRMEAGTLLAAAVATRGSVRVTGVEPAHLLPVTAKLRECGCSVMECADSIAVSAKELRAVEIRTMPYPGFPTDLQAPMAAVCCTADGVSLIEETIFENRFSYADELKRFGANIRVKDGSAIIRGGAPLSGAGARALDLRGGAAALIAALCASGTSRILGVEQIDRGYERLERKLSALGARVWRV